MKKFILPSVFVFALIITSCGPAAENRELMMSRSKVFQDSIANSIRASMDEAAGITSTAQGAPLNAPPTNPTQAK